MKTYFTLQLPTASRDQSRLPPSPPDTFTAILDQAVELARSATEADTRGDYENAVELYDQTVEYFLLCVKYETVSEKATDLIREKCKEYVDRAVKLRQYLQGRKVSTDFNLITVNSRDD